MDWLSFLQKKKCTELIVQFGQLANAIFVFFFLKTTIPNCCTVQVQILFHQYESVRHLLTVKSPSPFMLFALSHSMHLIFPYMGAGCELLAY